MKRKSNFIFTVCLLMSLLQCIENNKATGETQAANNDNKRIVPELNRKLFDSDTYGEKVKILDRKLLQDDGKKRNNKDSEDDDDKDKENDEEDNKKRKKDDKKGDKKKKTDDGEDDKEKDDDEEGNKKEKTDDENGDENNESNEDDEEEEKPEHPPFCHNELLYSYGILNSGLRESKSKLCGDNSKKTCCSPTSETIIHNFWHNNNRAKIKMYIEGYVWLFKAILNFYDDFVAKAKKIHSFPSAPSECREAADKLIESFIKPSDLTNYIPKLEKAYHLLGFARKGFYCALCSTDSQPYFDTIDKKIILAKQTCEKFVQTTIEDFYTRSVTYMKIFGYMNTIADCEPNQPYLPDVYEINFELDDESSTIITQCYESFKKDNDPRVFFDDCKNYCSRFSLTHAREIFEGNFGKVYFLYQKIQSESGMPSKLTFDEIDHSVKYDFSYISPDFFESNLKSFELDSYSLSFERNGIELFNMAAAANLTYKKHQNYSLVYQVGMSILGLVLIIFGTY